MPTFKVFVSSTYIDLKDHRRAVIDSLLRLKLQPVAMEFFGAKPEEPRQVCGDEIRGCDLFIGIYAHRYGFASEESDKSITEQEFDLARELGKPSFCYLIDEDHPWPPKFIEDEPGKSRLRAFKARIESAWVRDTFATPQDLAGRVSSDLGKWLAEHGTPIPSTPKVYHNLPHPDYGTFIGREEELAQVHRILRPYPHSQEHLVTIDGIGGIGKSALALETAHRYLREYEALPEEERFGAIIWTSAKSSVLTADGIAPRQQITRTLDDIYTTISVTLEREDITRARPEEQDELVRRALIQQRTLLIIDNLETIDDERVNAFLRELPAPTKAIVTTRHRIDVAYPVRLTGMPREDGLALIAQECAKKGVMLTQAEAEKLYDRTGGVPLAMVWSVAQMGFGHPVEAVLRRLGQPSEDIARYCFEGTMERIRGKPAHKLLMALSLFATDASREALGYVADLPELDQDEGLVALEKLSLLNRQAGRFSLLPLTRSYLAHELERTPQFAQSAFEGMLTYYKQLVTPPPEARVGILYWDGLANYARTESLQQESGNLIHVIRQALDQRRYAAALDLFLPIVHFLQFWGLWDERLHLGHEMCQAAHGLGDPAEVWLWIDNIGWIFRQRQQFSECIQALKRGKLLARQFELDEASILADVFEARLYAEMGDIGLALKKIEPALEQLDLDSVLEHSTPIIRRIVARRAVGVAAGLSELQQDFVREKEWYELELELRRSISENPAPSLWSLARVSLKLDDVASAEKFLGQALATAGQKDIAWINYYLAVVAEKRGEWQEARRLGTLALEQFTRLGHKSGVQDCQELLARLQE
jgi:tetratricopeptide (TPR) repeat protein